jgi:hypothetical protein
MAKKGPLINPQGGSILGQFLIDRSGQYWNRF